MCLKKKKILFITGTRADYGKLKPLMTAVEQSSKFDNNIYVSGMHLLKKFGSTYDEVLKGNFANVHIAFDLKFTKNMSINLGRTVISLSKHLEALKPDMIVVHGDRIDALAGAIAGALNNILVAHIEGGEISGTIDESIRHSISKFAHVHFTCNEEASKRLIQLGEKKESIFEIGSPDIDIMLSDRLPDITEVKRYYNINFLEYSILMYHPVTTEIGYIKKKVNVLIDALIKSNKNYIVIYPNNDTGSEIILQEYKKLSKNDKFKIFPSLRFEYFLTLLKNAEFIIGNSSAGIRESCIYGIPAIDIGNRQNGRYSLKKIKNIQHVAEDRDEILKAINHIKRYQFCSQHFGKGESNKLFMEYLESESVWDISIQKLFIDLGETI